MFDGCRCSDTAVSEVMPIKNESKADLLIVEDVVIGAASAVVDVIVDAVASAAAAAAAAAAADDDDDDEFAAVSFDDLYVFFTESRSKLPK